MGDYLMQRINTAQVLAYVSRAAEEGIKADMNEAGEWTPLEFKELKDRALMLISRSKEIEKQ